MLQLTVITPAPPCDDCIGRCCTAPHRKTLAELRPEEESQFPEAVRINTGLGPAMALPVTAEGRCIHLDDANRCRIYERRPAVCRDFNCLFGYRLGRNRHSFFLEDHPEMVTLIEQKFPEFVQSRIQEQQKRPVL